MLIIVIWQEDAKAAAEGDEADGIYEEIPDELKKKPETDEANSEKQEETTAKQEGAEKQEESADQEPKLRGRPLQRVSAVRMSVSASLICRKLCTARRGLKANRICAYSKLL